MSRASPGGTTWGFHPRPHDADASSVLRSSSAGKKATDPPQTGFARQLPLRNFVGKGSDAYQTIHRDIKENSVYVG